MEASSGTLEELPHRLVVHNLDLSFGHKEGCKEPPPPPPPVSSKFPANVDVTAHPQIDDPPPTTTPCAEPTIKSKSQTEKRKAKTPRKCSTPPNKKAPAAAGGGRRRRRTASETQADSGSASQQNQGTTTPRKMSEPGEVKPPAAKENVDSAAQSTPAKKRRKATPPAAAASESDAAPQAATQQQQQQPASSQQQHQYNVVNWGWSPQRGKFKPKAVVSVTESKSPPKQNTDPEQASDTKRKTVAAKRKLTMVKSENPESYTAKSKWQSPVSPLSFLSTSLYRAYHVQFSSFDLKITTGLSFNT